MQWMICSGSFCSQTNQTVSPGLGSRAISVLLSQWRRPLRRALSILLVKVVLDPVAGRRLPGLAWERGKPVLVEDQHLPRLYGRAAFPACGLAQRLCTL